MAQFNVIRPAVIKVSSTLLRDLVQPRGSYTAFRVGVFQQRQRQFLAVMGQKPRSPQRIEGLIPPRESKVRGKKEHSPSPKRNPLEMVPAEGKSRVFVLTLPYTPDQSPLHSNRSSGVVRSHGSNSPANNRLVSPALTRDPP
ncbi:MAG: hypothetical protein P4M11_08370 [Candidatus Pacebacteria bacterium]|nr:hypothetical protein [Candidatus Paceibacterota bacterium]